MRLKVMTPNSVVVDQEVIKVNAEAANGYFCLLPRHADFVASLVPGILYYTLEDGTEEFLGVNEGALVKLGPDALVSVSNAVKGPNLGQLKRRIEEEFEHLDEQEKKVRSAVSKLEADLVRRFMEIRKYGK
jgi:F-type H+-transporting ATPase subunit epsilon